MSNDDWKRIVNVSASSSAHIFRSLPGMPSGPGALCSFTCERSLWVPFFEILILGSCFSVSFGDGVKFVSS